MKKDLKRYFISLIIILVSFFSLFCASKWNSVHSQTNSTSVKLNSASGVWTSISPEEREDYVTGLGTREIRWGIPLGFQKSGLRFDGSGQQSITTGNLFLLSSFWHFNWVTRSKTAAQEATLQITLDFLEPNQRIVINDYRFSIWETTNTEPCPSFQISSVPCDDRIVFPNAYGTGDFLLGNNLLCSLKLEGFVDSYPGGLVRLSFITQEQKDSRAYLVARLLCEPVCIEYSPPPTAPRNIGIKIRDITCNLGNGIRIPYPTFSVGDGFLANGSINLRENDSEPSLQDPLLEYRYRLPQLGLTSSWLTTSTRYAPSMEVNECDIYTVYARARSQNRCEGWTEGPEISRSFEINYIPRVNKIDIYDNPNDGVSGHLNRSGAEYDFACDIDNPKTFTVVFKDDDGCGDLWESFPADTNICGGAKTPSLSLQAVNSATGTVFSGPVSPIPGSVRCEGENLVVADFSLEFVGDENVNLDIQAKADDLVGDSSGWRTAFSWTYDGRAPELEIESNIVVGVNELNVDWSARDDILSLSGVRGLRMSSRLTKGEILSLDDDYSPIIYDGREYEMRDPFGEWVTVWDPGLVSVPESRLRTEVSSIDLVDIGINQDGNLDFRLESVDRACNYSVTADSTMELGSPWIATRGGFVHSGNDVQLAVRQSLYSNILPSYPDAQEITSLSTELLTVQGSKVLGFGNRDYVYDLLDYDKKLNHSWYEILLNRAKIRDPEGTMWSLGPIDLSVCESSQYIYFVEGDLVVNPKDYENLSRVNTLSGCVFIVSGNISITEGDYKSEGVDPTSPTYAPGYDAIRGYFIADGEINIEFVDEKADVRDGLKVVGGLFATGGSTSIVLGRSLQLRDNLQFPTLIVFHDSRYLDVARKVLGDSFGGTYISDIGFKE